MPVRRDQTKARQVKQSPTPKQVEDGVSRICKVIGQIPCFHVYEEYVANRFATGEIEVSLKAMMHNAAMDSALLNMRCFNEFFKRGSKPDDLRSYHFPDLKMEVFLTLEEEQTISKFLAHLTTTGSDIATKPWFLDDMTIRGLQHGIQFL